MDGGIEEFPFSIVICAPVVKGIPWREGTNASMTYYLAEHEMVNPLQMNNVGERRGRKRETQGLGEYMTRRRCVWTRKGFCPADNLNASNSTPASSPRTIENRLLAGGLTSRVPLARLSHHYTAKHGYSGVVDESTGEWNVALLCSVMRVGSVCNRVMDAHVYGVDLVSVIFRSAFVYDTQVPPQASWCWGPSVITRGQIWCFCWVK